MCLQFNVAKLSKRMTYKENISIFTFILKVFNVIHIQLYTNNTNFCVLCKICVLCWIKLLITYTDQYFCQTISLFFSSSPVA